MSGKRYIHNATFSKKKKSNASYIILTTVKRIQCLNALSISNTSYRQVILTILILTLIKQSNMYYQGKTYDTIGQVFDEALRLAKNGTRSEIEDFFNAYAKTCSSDNGVDAEEGICIAKRNLGYFLAIATTILLNLFMKHTIRVTLSGDKQNRYGTSSVQKI